MAAQQTPVTTNLGWRKAIEPWFAAYALAGAAMSGLAGVLLPLGISHTSTAAHVGVVMATVSAASLTSPLWGNLADRYRAHRPLFAGGVLLGAAALLLFPLTTNVILWLALALALGLGMATSNTIANLLVVERHPKPEWDDRLAWMQACYGAGLVGGLALASLLSRASFEPGMAMTAAITAGAGVLGWLTTRTPARGTEPAPVVRVPVRMGDIAPGPAAPRSHQSLAEAFRRLGPDLRSPFSLFLAVWFLTNLGLAGVYALYPLLMRDVFDVSPSRSSLGYSAAMAIGLLLYSPAGKLSTRFGAARVLQAGIGTRLLATIAIALLGAASFAGRGWLAMVAFGVITLAYSALVVAGSVLASKLASVGEGEGMGLYNATSALSELSGSAGGGWAAHAWGYNIVSVFGAVGLGAGLILSLLLRPVRRRQPPQSTP